MSTDRVAGGSPGDDATHHALDDDAHGLLERSAARLALVHDIDLAILAAESTAEIAERVVERLRTLAGADRVAVAALDQARDVLIVLAFSEAGGGAGFAPRAEVPLREAADARILDRHETVVYRDLAGAALAMPALRAAADLGYRAAVLVPLVAGERLVGLVSMAGRDEGVTSEDNVAVATEVAAALAIAIEHAAARERLERSHTRLAIVHEIDRAILAAATTSEIAAAVAVHLLPLLSADMVGIAAYNGAHREMLAVAGEGADLVTDRLRRAGPQRPAPATIPAVRDVLTFDDLAMAIEVLPGARIAIELGMTVGSIVPLVVEDRVVGTVALAGRDRRLISPETVAIAREVGDQLAIAIDQARRREALERSAMRLQLVHEIDLGILASESPEDLAARVAGPLLRLAGARRLDISAYDVARDEGRILGFAHEDAGPATPAGIVYDLLATVPMVAQPRPSITTFADLARAAETTPLARNAAAAGLTHGAWIPMLTGGRLVGAVSMAGDGPTVLDPETLSMARAMTDQLAVALQHAEDRAELEERESRLRAILEASPNGILVVDASSRIRYANPAAHRLFGAPDGALAGASHDALVPPVSASTHAAGMRSWFADAAPDAAHPINAEARRLDGTTLPVHVLLARVVTDGEPLAIATVVDLSERSMLEARLRQTERLQVVGQFAGILAHDVRNYLTAIGWSADLLGAGLEPDDPRQADVGLIQRATRDAVDLTRRVLELARPSGDTRGALDVAAHLRGARAVLERILGDDLGLELDVEPGLPPAGISATALTQVLGNLAANARDAMPAGGTFRLGARLAVISPGSPDPDGGTLEPGRYVRLLASDTGTGMDEETRTRAFEAFFTTKTLPSAAGGTGLGLSSVFLLVTRAGGSVRVESEPGRGTTFIVDLPAAG